ncbi:bacillithiol biosynthesis cysteine-adding enzyme BshC [Chitinophagaceae bacterium IBVUCB1]|nr:bacillithiol biosynthesis cysteine-adding enzyme BshC [Chitinophagaceae bacterium IBVUCB1]
MDIDCTYIPYSNTGNFSDLVLDYLDAHPAIRHLYSYTPNAAGIAQAITDRNKYPVNRQLLADVLHKQYAHLTKHDKLSDNIAKLANDNTYTVCTAHQPNLLTGYLYFIYKIIHAIKLADELNTQHPDKHFVPVYYMGSEDNDLDELGAFRYNNHKYTWDAAGQTGAVGRMQTKSLKPLLDEVFKVLGPPGEHLDVLKEILTVAYLQHNTIADATQYLVNELFGKYGLVVLNPDDAELKKQIVPLLQDDLLNHTAYALVNEHVEILEEQYKVQAYPRMINLFYLHNDVRERIEKRGGKWKVLNTDIEWTEEALITELQTHPQRFSPNVILRGLYQESILPDVAFIGGGAEVAYWLELKAAFDNYKVFYPPVLLRQSVLWMNGQQNKLRQQLGFEVADVFKSEAALIRGYMSRHSTGNWQVDEETTAIQGILHQLKEKATKLDPTLQASADAAFAKMTHQLQILEKKMLRAEKRTMQDQLQRISRLKNSIAPNNVLQERYENFIGYYAAMGAAYFDTLYKRTEPLRNAFLVLTER